MARLEATTHSYIFQIGRNPLNVMDGYGFNSGGEMTLRVIDGFIRSQAAIRLNAEELRELAQHCLEAADMLEGVSRDG